MNHFGKYFRAFAFVLIFFTLVSGGQGMRVAEAQTSSSTNPNIMPPVPAEFGVGAQVKWVLETTVVEQVGDGIVLVTIHEDDGTAKRIWMPWKNLTLVTAAPSQSVTTSTSTTTTSTTTTPTTSTTTSAGTNPTSASCTAPITSRLTYGDRNAQVLVLQKFLASIDLLDEENTSGYFGPLTRAAVQKFQVNNSIVSSGTPETTGYGLVGPKTAQAINTMCGYSNEQVAAATATASSVSSATNTTTGTTTTTTTNSSTFVKLSSTQLTPTSVRLNWTSGGVTSCSSNDFYVDNTIASTSGNTTVNVSKTTTYSILCVKSTGTVSDHLTVTVEDGQIINGTTPTTTTTTTTTATTPSTGTVVFKAGDYVMINSANVRVRFFPTLAATVPYLGQNKDNIVGTRSQGEKGYIAHGPTVAEGHTWWNVQYLAGDGMTPTGLGWTAQEYLTLTTRDPVVTNTNPCPAETSASGFVTYPFRDGTGNCVPGSNVDSSVKIYNDIFDGKYPEAYGGTTPQARSINNGGANVGADGYLPLTNGSCLSPYAVVSGITRSGVSAKVCRFSGVAQATSSEKLPAVPIDATWYNGNLAQKQANIDANFYQMTFPQAFNGSTFTQAGNTKETIGLVFRYAVAKGIVPNTAAGYGTWSYWCGNSIGATTPKTITASAAATSSCLNTIADALRKDGRGMTWSASTADTITNNANKPTNIFSSLSVDIAGLSTKTYNETEWTTVAPLDTNSDIFLPVRTALTIPANASSVKISGVIKKSDLKSCEYAILNSNTLKDVNGVILPPFTNQTGWMSMTGSATVSGSVAAPFTGGLYALDVAFRCTDGSGSVLTSPVLHASVTRQQAIDVTAIQKRGSLGSGMFANYHPISLGFAELASVNSISKIVATPMDWLGQGTVGPILRAPVGTIEGPDASILRAPQTFLCSGYFGNCSNNPAPDQYQNALATVGATTTLTVSTSAGSGAVTLPTPPWGGIFAVRPPTSISAPNNSNVGPQPLTPVLQMCYTQADVTAGKNYIQTLSPQGNPSPQLLATYNDPRLAAINSCGSSASSCVNTLNANVKEFNRKNGDWGGFTVDCN